MMPNDSLDFEDQFPRNCVNCNRDLKKSKFFQLAFEYTDPSGETIKAVALCLCPDCHRDLDPYYLMRSYQHWYSMLPDELQRIWIWLAILEALDHVEESIARSAR